MALVGIAAARARRGAARRALCRCGRRRRARGAPRRARLDCRRRRRRGDACRDWNLVVVLRGVDGPADSGALAEPVGYANGVAILCVVGLVLLPRLPRPALVAALPLAADLVKQASTGALAALAAALLGVRCSSTRPRLRPLVGSRSSSGSRSRRSRSAATFRSQYWRVAVRRGERASGRGLGAGTFSTGGCEKRHVPFSTQEAHALYLETLAELGPVGLALLLAALAVPLAAAVRIREPALAAALSRTTSERPSTSTGSSPASRSPRSCSARPPSCTRRRRGRNPRASRCRSCDADGGGASRLRGRCTARVGAGCAPRHRIGAVAEARAHSASRRSRAAWGVIGDAESTPPPIAARSRSTRTTGACGPARERLER